MNIITKEEILGRLEDGINTLLQLDEESFERVINDLQPTLEYSQRIAFYYTTDRCERPSNPIQLGLEKSKDNKGRKIARSYGGEKSYSIREIFEALEIRLSNLEPNSIEYIRIKKILKTRDLNSFKQMHLKEDSSNAGILDKVFQILSDEETFKKFLDFENNRQEFSENGREVPLSEYLQYLAIFFGMKDKNGQLTDENKISRDFFIKDLEMYKQRYYRLYDAVNLDRYANPKYEFRRGDYFEKILRNGSEPNWTIKPEVYKELYYNIPENLSPEDQVIWIYSKMCQMFLYDEGYFYRDRINDGKYESDFSKEHLESLVPGAKITCFDFVRMFFKLVNEIEGDIEAVIIAEGINFGHHFRSGFYTDRVSAELDPVNLQAKHITNDMTNAKNGMELEGIKIISDREGILKQSIKKVYPMVIGRQPSCGEEFKKSLAEAIYPQNQEITVTDIGILIEELRELPREEISSDFQEKLETFIEIMRENKVSGNEFAQTLEELRRAKFFGVDLYCAYLGERVENEEKQKRYKRKILLRQKITDSKTETQQENSMWLIDTESLELSVCSVQDISKKLKSGEFIYEDDEHKMERVEEG